jgi:hypothetical protein
MFQRAYKIAMGYTAPVIISRRTIAGECSSGVAACVLLNEDGWILSSSHVLKMIPDLMIEEAETRRLEAEIQSVGGRPANRHERRRHRSGHAGPKPTATDRWSVMAGPGLGIELVIGLEIGDLALGKLRGFVPDPNMQYPVFKNPTADLEGGTSLCRLGFPFHHFEPTYDPLTNSFNLPIGALPMATFANEGIFSRGMDVLVLDEVTRQPVQTPFPIKFIETSSAGLRGQSGGPIFDSEGRIWGIQSSTTSYAMDLNTDDTPQYYHVGVGTHCATIIGFLTQNNIKHQVSKD